MIDAKFLGVADFWDLERLYLDLSAIKKGAFKSSGKDLSGVEWLYLTGVLARCSPAEIAKQCHVSSGTVRSCLSDRVYPYIKRLAQQMTGTSPAIKHWSHVVPLLEELGYRRRFYSEETVGLPSRWSGAPQTDILFGRDQDLALLRQWITIDRQQIVHLTGAEGIGKTTLAVTLAQMLEQEHGYAVLWLSMATAPSPENALQAIQQLWGTSGAAPPTFKTLGPLLQNLPSQPWLVVLDAVENLVEQGRFLPVYRNYTLLLRQICETEHGGCVLLTSSEKIGYLSLLEDRGLPIKSLRLEGLTQAAIEDLLQHLQVQSKDCCDYERIKQTYGGNPQLIRLLAASVNDLFGGHLATLTQLEPVFLGESMQTLLDAQWQRLSPVEKLLAQRLAAAQAPVSALDLQASMVADGTAHDWVNGLQRLRERSLIEVIIGPTGGEIHYVLQPTVRRFLSDYLTADQESVP